MSRVKVQRVNGDVEGQMLGISAFKKNPHRSDRIVADGPSEMFVPTKPGTEEAQCAQMKPRQ